MKRRNWLEDVLKVDAELKELSLAYQMGAHSFLTKPCRAEDIQNLTRAFAGHWESSPTKMKPASNR
jgi:hypothetical protein